MMNHINQQLPLITLDPRHIEVLPAMQAAFNDRAHLDSLPVQWLQVTKALLEKAHIFEALFLQR
jgi:hypothetical protein